MLPLNSVEIEIPALNYTWLRIVQRAVRADIGSASDFGLTVAQGNLVDTLSPRDVRLVADTWRSVMFVPRSVMAVESELRMSQTEQSVDANAPEGEAGRFFFSYLQLVSGLCRIDHSCAGERFWLPSSLTAALRTAPIGALADVARSPRASSTVARSASLLERMIVYVTSNTSSGPFKPPALVVMSMASLLVDDSMKVG